jgi:hypothetical protein
MRPRNSEGFAIVTEDNSKATLCGRGIWDVRIWIGLGLTFLVLNSLGNSGPASPYRFSEWILYALLLIGLWANWKFNLRALANSSFIALPLLFIDEELLWRNAKPARRHAVPYFWFLGFVLALPIRISWGLVYSPMATDLFDLPPNVAGS